MKIMVFTEGTILMHKNADGLKDYASYVPIGSAAAKIKKWAEQDAQIIYLTSRQSEKEIGEIKNVLSKFGFPEGELEYRKNNEEYKDVAERILPDVLIEDDCESLGGQNEMTYTHLSPETKTKIKSIVVKEFSGIDSLSNDVSKL